MQKHIDVLLICEHEAPSTWASLGAVDAFHHPEGTGATSSPAAGNGRLQLDGAERSIEQYLCLGP